MCYATSLRKGEKEIEERFSATQRVHLLYEPYYHRSGLEHSNLFIIPQDSIEEIHPALWGYVPNFAMENIDTFYKINSTLNVRCEEVFSLPDYKNAVRRRRCLIIADGFYLPHHKDNVPYPYFSHMKDDSIFAFAGVYSKIDDDFYSCSILTKEANGFFEKINNSNKRMPLILNDQFEREWLRNDLNEDNIRELLRVGFTTDELEAYPVSLDLYAPNRPKDVPWAISKIEYPELGGQDGLYE